MSAYRRILRLRSRFPAYLLAPNTCASLVSVECLLVTWSTHAQTPKFASNPWNRLAVSTEFPASVERRFCAYGKQRHEIGPWSVTIQVCPMPSTPTSIKHMDSAYMRKTTFTWYSWTPVQRWTVCCAEPSVWVHCLNLLGWHFLFWSIQKNLFNVLKRKSLACSFIIVVVCMKRICGLMLSIRTQNALHECFDDISVHVRPSFCLSIR